MPLRNELDSLLADIQDKRKLLEHNEILFNIFEGELLCYIEADLQRELSLQSFDQARYRITPINLLKKIIDKLSKIYQEIPIRIVEEGSNTDTELLTWYEKSFRVNQKMNVSNEFFNLFKASLVQVYLWNGMPQIRAIPNHKFIVHSYDRVDPTKPTHYTLIMGKRTSGTGEIIEIYHTYTDEEFLVWSSRKEVLIEDMIAFGNPEGINPFGKAPFVYTNRSANLLTPKPDSDTLRMTKIIPILISDLNYAVKFQSFSIMYSVDLDDENITMAPNAFWHFKSDPTKDKTPEIGSIKPQVDIPQVMELIQAELSLWLNSRGIKPGSIGTLTADNAASGIAKMLDEMDTTDERKKQVAIYTDAECEMWDLVANYMHPYWVKNQLIENRAMFTPSAEVVVRFAEQLPLLSRGDLVRDLKDEVEARFTSKHRAIKVLNPAMTDEQIDELIAEIDEELTLEIPQETEETQTPEETKEVEDAV